MKKVIITGISGTLGSALGKEYRERGCQVIGVTRQQSLEGDFFNELCICQQKTTEDAKTIDNWIDKGQGWIGTYKEPFSLRIFKYLFVLSPNFFYKLQLYGWRKGSKFVIKEKKEETTSINHK